MISNKRGSISDFESLRLMGERFKLFIPFGIHIQRDLDYINTTIQLQSFGALKRYMNYENLTHDLKKENSNSLEIY